MPQQGKLKALICTATPRSGVKICWATKRAVAREALDLAFDQEPLRRQFAPAARGVGEQHAEAALDVDGAVGAGRAGGEGELIELLLALAQILRERLQQLGAGVEVERAQSLAGGAAVGERGGEVEAGGIDRRDRRAGRSVAGEIAFAGAVAPLAADVALQSAHG